jgi:hypothetical protein
MMIYATVRKSRAKTLPKKAREEYEAWLKKHNVSSAPKKPTTKEWSYKFSTPVGRENSKVNSLNTGLSYAGKQESKIYTGNNVLGIATMHKSIAVPVFSREEAESVSKMRR